MSQHIVPVKTYVLVFAGLIGLTLLTTGAAFIDSSGPPPYAGHLVFCSYDGGMRIVSPGTPHAMVSSGPSVCKLAVVEGPNHALYVSDTGSIYKVG